MTRHQLRHLVLRLTKHYGAERRDQLQIAVENARRIYVSRIRRETNEQSKRWAAQAIGER